MPLLRFAGVDFHVMQAQLAQAFQHDEVERLPRDAGHSTLGPDDQLNSHFGAGCAQREDGDLDYFSDLAAWHAADMPPGTRRGRIRSCGGAGGTSSGVC